ncbi:hypothetical protein ABFS83_14G300500 [Erythranthe nasuta]
MYGSEEQPYFSSHKISQLRKNPSMGILQSPPLLLPYTLQQPPLLPHPTAHPHRSSSSRGGLSSPPSTRNSYRIKDHPPLTTKKSTKIPRKEDKKSPIAPKGIHAYGNNKSVTRVSNGSGRQKAVDEDRVDNMIPGFAGLAISSPPPSSLPLPTFSLRRKPIRP